SCLARENLISAGIVVAKAKRNRESSANAAGREHQSQITTREVEDVEQRVQRRLGDFPGRGLGAFLAEFGWVRLRRLGDGATSRDVEIDPVFRQLSPVADALILWRVSNVSLERGDIRPRLGHFDAQYLL